MHFLEYIKGMIRLKQYRSGKNYIGFRRRVVKEAPLFFDTFRWAFIIDDRVVVLWQYFPSKLPLSGSFVHDCAYRQGLLTGDYVGHMKWEINWNKDYKNAAS